MSDSKEEIGPQHFNDFGLSSDVREALDYMNYSKPTPIQSQAIPYALEGRDLIGCAQTGTGKTAAFLIPMIEKINKQEKGGIKTLIVTPTRELALQIDQQFDGLAFFTTLSSVSLYGGGNGADFDTQKNAIKQGVDVLVATPGKLLSHLKLGYVNFDDLSFFILDEADRMLDMGFVDDIYEIASYLPKTRQTLMFSATMPPPIRTLAKTLLNNPAEVSLAVSKPAAGVTQEAFVLLEDEKVDLLKHLIDNNQDFRKIIVFAPTKAAAKYISFKLQSTNYPAKSIHSDKAQSEREEIMLGFKQGKYKVLVATDVISRGIDWDDIDLVVNYSVPQHPEDYVHRVGRTARAENKGLAITFVSPRERATFYRIENFIEQEVPKMPLPEGEAFNSNVSYIPEIFLNRKPQEGRDRKGGGRKPFHKGGKNNKGRKPFKNRRKEEATASTGESQNTPS